MREIIIRDPWFNAADYPDIQSAIDAATQSGGPARLVIPPGVHDCAGLVVTGGDLEIYGPGATLRLSPGTGAAGDTEGTVLTVTDPIRFRLNVDMIDANAGVETVTGKALLYVWADPNGATKEISINCDTTGRADHFTSVFVRSAGVGDPGARRVTISGTHENPGHHSGLFIRGAHEHVFLDRVTYRDPLGQCVSHGVDISGEATIDADACGELLVRDFRGEWASRDMMFLQNVRHIRIEGFTALHQGKSINGPADSMSQPLKVDHYKYRPGYTCYVQDLVTRDSHPTQVLSSVWLAEGVRDGVVINPDVDADIRLGATALAGDDDGRRNHLRGGCVWNKARVLMAPGSIVDGTWFGRNDGGTTMLMAIQTTGDTTVKNVHLTGYRSIWAIKKDPGLRLIDVTMDETCEIYHARHPDDAAEIQMFGVHGGRLNVQPVATGVTPALRLDMRGCSVDVSSALRAKLEANATLCADGNVRWNGSTFERVIDDVTPA